MEVTPSVTVIFTQEELLNALKGGNAAALFDQTIDDGILIDVGNVDGEEPTRTIVGPPGVMHQIFPELVETETL